MEDLNDNPKKKPPSNELVIPFPDSTPLEHPKEDITTPTHEVPVTSILTPEERERLYEKDDDEPWWKK